MLKVHCILMIGNIWIHDMANFCHFSFSEKENHKVEINVKVSVKTFFQPALPGRISFDTQDVEAQPFVTSRGYRKRPEFVAGRWVALRWLTKDALEKSEEAEAVTSFGIPSFKHIAPMGCIKTVSTLLMARFKKRHNSWMVWRLMKKFFFV